MFTKIVGKQCPNQECKEFRVMVDKGLNLCESCTTELSAVTVRDSRALTLTLLALAVVVALAVVSVRVWLVRRATASLEAICSQLVQQISAGAPDALAILERRIEDFQKRGVSPEHIQHLRSMARDAQEKRDSLVAGKNEFTSALRGALKDGRITPEQEGGLKKLRDRLSARGIDSAWFDAQTKSVQERVARSRMEISTGLDAAKGRDYPAAVASFKQSVEDDDQNAFAWANLCAAYVGSRDLEHASGACDRAIELDGSNWLGYYNRACVEALQKKDDAAISSLGRALGAVASNVALREQLISRMRADETFAPLSRLPAWKELGRR